MTAAMRLAIRARHYTYGEVLAFAQFYQLHRNENSPENLLANFLKWKQVEGDLSLRSRKLLIIEEVVAGYYGLALQDVRAKRRYAELVRARQVIAYFTVKHASQQQIASCVGMGRNSVQYGKDKTALMLGIEPQLRKEVDEIASRLVAPLEALDKQEQEIAKLKNEDENETGNVPAAVDDSGGLLCGE